MLAIERLRMSRIKTAILCRVRIVKPETDMERIRRRQPHIRIKAKDVIQQNCLDADMAVVTMLDLNIGLVPRQPKAAVEYVGECWIFCAVRQQRAALHSKQIKSQARTDAVQVKNQRVIILATDHSRARPRLLSVAGPQAIDCVGIRYQIKGDLISLLCRGNAG